MANNMEIEIAKFRFARTKNMHKRDEIELPLEYKNIFYENQKALVTFFLKQDSNSNSQNSGEEITNSCFLVFTSNVKLSYAKVSKNLIPLKYKDLVDKIVIKKLSEIKNKRYDVANVKSLEKNSIRVGYGVYNKYLKKDDKAGLLIVNNLNGYRMYINRNEIEYSFDLKKIEKMNMKNIEEKSYLNDYCVSFSSYHRRLLDIEVPTFIEKYYLDIVKDNSEKNDLDKLYHDGGNIKFEDYYQAKAIIKKELKAANIDIYSIYSYNPVEKKWYKGILKKFLTKVLSFFIGQKDIVLRVVRPAVIDESDNVVKLSKNSMMHLGVEEFDKVKISFKDKNVTARVTEITKPSLIFSENRIKNEDELSIVVGIPAHLRNKLGLKYINDNVVIRRDIFFLFKKYLNKQLFPIFGAIVSLSVIQYIKNIWLQIGLIIALIILFTYLSFSEVRERI